MFAIIWRTWSLPLVLMPSCQWTFALTRRTRSPSHPFIHLMPLNFCNNMEKRSLPLSSLPPVLHFDTPLVYNFIPLKFYNNMENLVSMLPPVPPYAFFLCVGGLGRPNFASFIRTIKPMMLIVTRSYPSSFCMNYTSRCLSNEFLHSKPPPTLLPKHQTFRFKLCFFGSWCFHYPQALMQKIIFLIALTTARKDQFNFLTLDLGKFASLCEKSNFFMLPCRTSL